MFVSHYDTSAFDLASDASDRCWPCSARATKSAVDGFDKSQLMIVTKDIQLLEKAIASIFRHEICGPRSRGGVVRPQRLRLALVCCAFCTVSAQISAAVIRVESDRFPVGTDIRTAFPGVALSVVSQTDTVVVPAIGTSVFLGGANISTTGRKVFARSPRGNCALQGGAIVDTAKTWSTFCGILRADFSSLTDFVSIDVIFDDDDAGFLAAFDSAGTLLEEVHAAGDGRGATPSARLRLDRLVRDVAFITAGGLSAEGLYLDNLRFRNHVLPEPALLILMAIALAALSSRRRNRRFNDA